MVLPILPIIPQNSMIIDNVVVSEYNSILQIVSISYLQKKGIDISGIKKKTFGSRILENKILTLLSDGVLNFSDL